MMAKDLFGDEIQDSSKKSMEEFLSGLDQGKVLSLKVGSRVTGTILSITADTVLVDVKSVVDGVLPKKDLLNSQGEISHKVGDSLSCVVKRVTPEEISLKFDGATLSMGEDGDLEDAFDHETPVEGRVVEEVKGGFRVLLSGQVKAFCPVSQMDYRVSSSADYINNKYEFLIIKYESGGRNVVVSRRRALDGQKVERESQFLAKVKPSDLLLAEVVRIEKFGAFVRLKDWDLEGLIPLSELAWSRVRGPEEVVTLGQDLQVMLLTSTETEEGRLRLSFSLKQAGSEGDPWAKVALNFSIGTQCDAVVEKKEPFGLFLQITPGVTGLLPRSAYKDDVMAREIENKKRGDLLRVSIREIHYEEKKILLGLVGSQDESFVMPHQTQSMGTFADLLKNSLVKKV
jgi:small subunit ribosomal protein S1